MLRFLLALMACTIASSANAKTLEFKYDHWLVRCIQETRVCGATVGGRGKSDSTQWVRIVFEPGKQHKITIVVPPIAKTRDSIVFQEDDRPNGVLFMHKDDCGDKRCEVFWHATARDIRRLGMAKTLMIEYSTDESHGHSLILPMDGFSEAFAKMKSFMYPKRKSR